MDLKLKLGKFDRFGAVNIAEGIQFTFSVSTLIEPAILLFDIEKKKMCEKILLGEEYRRGLVYSVIVSGIDAEKYCYLLERDGSVAVDEYAYTIIGREKWNNTKRFEEDYRVYGGFSSKKYNWKNENKYIAPDDMVIYKLHLRGYTMQQGLAESSTGTYRGIIRRLSEIRDFGITTIEFQPIYEFEDLRYKSESIINKSGQLEVKNSESFGVNFWGYGKGNYFAPKASYFGGENVCNHAKEMIDAIHGKDMEIIMEMSFAEECTDDFIIACLRFWVSEYHVDGFHLVGMGLPIERIVSDRFLAATKIFYDHFPYDLLEKEKTSAYKHLFVYDDAFIYPLRKLQNHMEGSIIEFANIMKRQHSAYSFVNFAAQTANGFSLWDVYTYSEKHNEANGEDNTDGNNYNFSHNYGVEGETNSRTVLNFRFRHVRSALAAAILSQSVPMICAGDEIGNTQFGNNNAYCQDNETGWVTFSRKAANKKLKEYTRDLIAFRKAHKILAYPEPMQMTDHKHKGMPDLSYHGKEPWIMWLSDNMRSIGMFYNGDYGINGKEEDVMLLFNFYFQEEPFTLPSLNDDKKWYFVTNTSDEVFINEKEPLCNQKLLMVPGGSLTILVGKTEV